MLGAETKRFNIQDAVRLEETPGGLIRAAVCTPEAEADVYLQGAHVTNWTPRTHRPVLFVSPRSLFVPGKAIRGGVPVIWPWFGPRSAGLPGAAHGFARTTQWVLENTRVREDGRVEISMALTPDDATRGLGYSAFRLNFRVSIGSTLDMELETRNESDETLTYEEALHSYFAIADINKVSVSGLEETTYIDKTDKFQRKQQGSEPLRISKETDQVHLNTKSACVVYDPVWDRRIIIEKSGSESTVVWNPGMDKTKGMSDMAPEDWQKMICVESANALDNAVRLAPGASHKLTASIRVV